MNFNALFNKRARTPADVVKTLKDAIAKMDGSTTGSETRRKVRYSLFALEIWLERVLDVAGRRRRLQDAPADETHAIR
jgi:hypothetical protein